MSSSYIVQAISTEEARSLSDMLDKLRDQFDRFSNGRMEDNQDEK
jgi:hypothetical protein